MAFFLSIAQFFFCHNTHSQEMKKRLRLRKKWDRMYNRESRVFDTGLHIELPKNSVGFLKSKSGLYMKHGITSEGVVDEGYTGSIRVKLINHSDVPYVVNKGDKISQLVILPILKPELEVVDSLEETERGSKGFGSSGK